MTRFEKIMAEMTPDRLAKFLANDLATCEGCAFRYHDEWTKNKECNEIGCLKGTELGLREEVQDETD